MKSTNPSREDQRFDVSEEIFRGSIPSAEGLSLCPNSERYGGIYLCSARATDLGATDSERIAALFKCMYCLYEEVPYVEWSSTEALPCITEYRSWRQAQKAIERPVEAFVESLRTPSQAVVDAQRSLAQPCNPPRFLREGVTGEVSEDLLPILSAETLVVVLDDRWSSPAGLFRSHDRIVLLQWWTDA